MTVLPVELPTMIISTPHCSKVSVTRRSRHHSGLTLLKKRLSKRKPPTIAYTRLSPVVSMAVLTTRVILVTAQGQNMTRPLSVTHCVSYVQSAL